MNLPILSIAAIICVLLLLITWGLHLKIKNAGIVDIAWAGGFTILVLFYALASNGNDARRFLISWMVILWSLRLTFHLARRVKKQHPQEDSRYADLRRAWSDQYAFKSFLFFQMQALFLWILSVPFGLINSNPEPRIQLLEWISTIVWSFSLLGETIADRQLKNFKSKPENKYKVCETGLWAYSRHPNYFFEWMVWVSYFLFACSSAYGWLTVYAPMLMLFLLLKVTGIPALEEMSLKTKGDAYRNYQNKTSVFVPWFRKTPAHL